MERFSVLTPLQTVTRMFSDKFKKLIPFVWPLMGFTSFTGAVVLTESMTGFRIDAIFSLFYFVLIWTAYKLLSQVHWVWNRWKMCCINSIKYQYGGDHYR